MGHTPRLVSSLLWLLLATPAPAGPLDTPAQDDRLLAGLDTVVLQIADRWRSYAGGGRLLHRNPDELDPLGVQAGLEYKSPAPVATAISYPVAAIDVQSFEDSDWRPNLSVRAGVELRSGKIAGTRVQLLAEYFTGRSPDGRFFERSLEYAGVGVRVLF